MKIEHDFLKLKNSVTVFWLLDFSGIDRDYICVRYFDLIESYLFPLQFPLEKNDIADYILMMEKMNFIDFLKYKSYVSTESDFINFFDEIMQHSRSKECYRISFCNLAENDISVLRSLIKYTWQIVDTEKFSLLPANVSIKRGLWDCKNRSFSQQLTE